MKLLDLFRSGKDTLQISEHLGGESAGWTEARVYRVLNAERREERAVPVTWQDVKPKDRKHHPTAKARKSVPYAGYNGRPEWNNI
jgi:hypothetical protein